MKQPMESKSFFFMAEVKLLGSESKSPTKMKIGCNLRVKVIFLNCFLGDGSLTSHLRFTMRGLCKILHVKVFR